jgi:hypothetical protein
VYCCSSAKGLSLCFGAACVTVIESHPDNALEDLRLDKPFPELREHFQSYDLDHMEKKVGRVYKLTFTAIFFLFFYHQDVVLKCNSGWSQTHNIPQAGLELLPDSPSSVS